MKRFPFCLALILTYLLGTHDGFVALWKCGEKEPSEVFPYRLESLPLPDQETLKKGIRIESEAELSQLLEDYLS